MIFHGLNWIMAWVSLALFVNLNCWIIIICLFHTLNSISHVAMWIFVFRCVWNSGFFWYIWNNVCNDDFLCLHGIMSWIFYFYLCKYSFVHVHSCNCVSISYFVITNIDFNCWNFLHFIFIPLMLLTRLLLWRFLKKSFQVFIPA